MKKKRKGCNINFFLYFQEQLSYLIENELTIRQAKTQKVNTMVHPQCNGHSTHSTSTSFYGWEGQRLGFKPLEGNFTNIVKLDQRRILSRFKK